MNTLNNCVRWEMVRAFSPEAILGSIPRAVALGWYCVAPLALQTARSTQNLFSGSTLNVQRSASNQKTDIEVERHVRDSNPISVSKSTEAAVAPVAPLTIV